MRCVIGVVTVLCLGIGGLVCPASGATPVHIDPHASLDVVQKWIYNYRVRPDPAHVPAAVRILVQVNAFKAPDSAGIYLGFIAGAIGADPAKADDLVEKLFPLPPEDQWVVVRAIAYSGLPDWKRLMEKFAERMPSRRVMIDDYLSGKLPTLIEIPLEEAKPTFGDKMKGYFTIDRYFKDTPPAEKKLTFDQNTDLLDTLWGYYFASGSYAPILRVVSMLPWSKDKNSIDKLTIGSMAKFTLANYAVRDTELRDFLKSEAPHQPKEVAAVLKEVIDAADTVQIAQIRKEATGAMEELKIKGPNYKRDITFWGQVGVGVVAAGCVVAEALGQVAFGIPCVVGGSLSEGALSFWSKQQ